jgi:hypothetical protein
MKLTLNHRPVAAAPDDGETLESLLDGLRGRGEIRSDEVVVELRVDSRAWQADDMAALASTRLADLSEVAIATDEVRGCARRILVDCRSMLDVLEQAVPRVAEQFRSGPPEQANEALYNLLNALQQFMVCLYHVRNTCALKSDPLGASGDLLGGLAACLDDIHGGQEREDWRALGCLLADGLPPALQRFEVVLQDMIDDA